MQERLLKGQAFPRKKGQRVLFCNLCGRGRFTQLSLKWHKIKDHDHRACLLCKGTFVDKNALNEHPCPMRNIVCDLCPGQVYRSHRGWMKHHRKVHEGLLHVCHICGLPLRDVDCLRVHIEALHPSGRKVVVPPCPICGKQLKSRVALSHHKSRVHRESAKSGPCLFCGRIFCSKFRLRHHVATVHRLETAGQPAPVKMEKKAGEEQTREEEERKSSSSSASQLPSKTS